MLKNWQVRENLTIKKFVLFFAFENDEELNKVFSGVTIEFYSSKGTKFEIFSQRPA